MSREEVKEAISSNLCRCTGYAFIVDSVLDAAQRMKQAGHEPPPGDTQRPATDEPDVPERVPGGEEARA